MTDRSNVLLIDDSAVIRGLLGRCIDRQDDLAVIGTAANGKMGVEKVAALQPDVVVLDIEMPVMDGLTALGEIRKVAPGIPVIMFSTLTAHGASATIKALSAGAADYATKPSNTEGINDAIRQVEAELLGKIRALAGSRRRRKALSAAPAKATPPPTTRAPRARVGLRTQTQAEAVVVGSSTGGPVALETFLGGISRPLPVPMFVVQHMPPKFTEALAQRLDGRVATTVSEAQNGQRAEAGACYIAPGGQHMRLEGDRNDVTIRIYDGPPVNSCKPAVDPMFESAAEIFKDRLVAVMLTGMGRDGLEGTRRIVQSDCVVIAQDEETSVVWGMPGQVAKAGLATDVLPIDQIGPRLASMYRMAAAMAPSGGAGGKSW